MNFCVIFFTVLICVGFVQPNGITLSLYYETICPDDRAFILNQLMPTYQKLKKMILEFIPFGKGNVVNSGPTPVITCQHGETECYGNRVQGCYFEKYANDMFDFEKQLALVKCMFEKDNWLDTNATSAECASELSLNWPGIEQCATGVEGLNIAVANGAKTNALVPALDFVPWIVIEGVHTDAMRSEALVDLEKFLCTNYFNQPDGTEWEECRATSQSPGSPTSEITTTSIPTTIPTSISTTIPTIFLNIEFH